MDQIRNGTPNLLNPPSSSSSSSLTASTNCTVRNLIEAVAKIRHQKQCATVVRIHKAVRQQLQKNLDIEEVIQQLAIATNTGALWRVDNNGVTSYREPPKGSSKEQIRWSQKDAVRWSNKDLQTRTLAVSHVKYPLPDQATYPMSDPSMFHHMADQFTWPVSDARRWTESMAAWNMVEPVRQHLTDSIGWPMNDPLKMSVNDSTINWQNAEQYRLSMHENFPWPMNGDGLAWSISDPWRTIEQQFRRNECPSTRNVMFDGSFQPTDEMQEKNILLAESNQWSIPTAAMGSTAASLESRSQKMAPDKEAFNQLNSKQTNVDKNKSNTNCNQNNPLDNQLTNESIVNNNNSLNDINNNVNTINNNNISSANDLNVTNSSSNSNITSNNNVNTGNNTANVSSPPVINDYSFHEQASKRIHQSDMNDWHQMKQQSPSSNRVAVDNNTQQHNSGDISLNSSHNTNNQTNFCTGNMLQTSHNVIACNNIDANNAISGHNINNDTIMSQNDNSNISNNSISNISNCNNVNQQFLSSLPQGIVSPSTLQQQQENSINNINKNNNINTYFESPEKWAGNYTDHLGSSDVRDYRGHCDHRKVFNDHTNFTGNINQDIHNSNGNDKINNSNSNDNKNNADDGNNDGHNSCAESCESDKFMECDLIGQSINFNFNNSNTTATTTTTTTTTNNNNNNSGNCNDNNHDSNFVKGNYEQNKNETNMEISDHPCNNSNNNNKNNTWGNDKAEHDDNGGVMCMDHDGNVNDDRRAANDANADSGQIQDGYPLSSINGDENNFDINNDDNNENIDKPPELVICQSLHSDSQSSSLSSHKFTNNIGGNNDDDDGYDNSVVDSGYTHDDNDARSPPHLDANDYIDNMEGEKRSDSNVTGVEASVINKGDNGADNMNNCRIICDNTDKINLKNECNNYKNKTTNNSSNLSNANNNDNKSGACPSLDGKKKSPENPSSKNKLWKNPLPILERLTASTLKSSYFEQQQQVGC
ncbi:hypothetical protein HELRODRAFT_175685 [Helobdella robusta]|uniref:SAMD1-like winged helix (WH) domain-containing protein n=1 Tax=Helobdella robusta TaxID=6412 RepID=T1F9I9_HELRO|nr:hypothetical protein HELRODRAFT_175685 [Helobdella robusta]ESO00698.1 hypothetical protein HELRODRAFT_175685 [Helobdella robusta]